MIRYSKGAVIGELCHITDEMVTSLALATFNYSSTYKGIKIFLIQEESKVQAKPQS